MKIKKANEPTQITNKSSFSKYPILSVKYGSPFGDRRTKEENLLVLQTDRLLATVHDN